MIDLKKVTIKNTIIMGGDTMHDYYQVCMTTLMRMHGGKIILLDCMAMSKLKNTIIIVVYQDMLKSA